MSKINKKLFNRVFIKQCVIAVTGLMLLILISQPLYKTIKKRYLINKEIEKLKDEISIYQSKNVQLVNLIKYLESDQFIEEQARKNLGLVKEGENVIVLKGSDDEKETKNADNSVTTQKVYDIGGSGNETKQKITNPVKWISYFLK
jgi:cell division protein FtsB